MCNFYYYPILKYYWLIIVHNHPVSIFACVKLRYKLILTICRKIFHLQSTRLHCAYLLSHLCDLIKQSYQTYSVLPLLKKLRCWGEGLEQNEPKQGDFIKEYLGYISGNSGINVSSSLCLLPFCHSL